MVTRSVPFVLDEAIVALAPVVEGREETTRATPPRPAAFSRELVDRAQVNSLRTAERGADARLNPSRPAVRAAEMGEKGRGVVAARRIRAGEIFDRVPVLVIPAGQAEVVESTLLENYVYNWHNDGVAVALGVGSLYTQAFAPVAQYIKRFDDAVIEYQALVDIEIGMEITVNYNGDPKDQTPVWFHVAE